MTLLLNDLIEQLISNKLKTLLLKEKMKNSKIHIRFDKEKHQCINMKSNLRKHFTHRTFVQDIADLIIKDSSVRVRMLVN